MCMLSLITPEAEVNYEHLDNGALQNRDGYGWALVTHKGPDGLLTYRTMDRKLAISTFKETREKHPRTFGLFHSRWSTGGKKDTSNCHPFQVGTDPMTVLAHNGVFSGLQPAWQSGDPRSDTAVFAQEVVPARFRRLNRPGVRVQLEKAIGAYNKVAIVTANPRYHDHAYLFNEEAGQWVDGVWHSNSDYKDSHRHWATSYKVNGEEYSYDAATGIMTWESQKTGKVYSWREEIAQPGECPVCLADMRETVNLATGECQMCGCCVDCKEWFPDCTCATSFIPGRHGLDSDSRAFVIGSTSERLALPPGSGSATRYGDGFDGEGDEEIIAEPEDKSDCYYDEDGWCRSAACKYLHRLALGDDGKWIKVVDPGDVAGDYEDLLTRLDR